MNKSLEGMEENGNNKNLTNADSLIYSFLEEVEIGDNDQLLDKKCSVEEFLTWLDNQYESKSSNKLDSAEKENIKETVNDNPHSINLSTKNLDPNSNITKLQEIIKNKVSCAANVITKNEQIATISNNFYLKCQNTTKNLKPTFRVLFSALRYEVNQIKNNNSNWPNALNLNITDKMKKASDSFIVSLSNIKDTFKNNIK